MARTLECDGGPHLRGARVADSGPVGSKSIDFISSSPQSFASSARIT